VTPEFKAAPWRMRQAVDPRLLAWLLAGDLVFIVLHGVNELLPVSYPLLSLNADNGYSEAFQYGKECCIALALLAAGWRRREGLLGAWALLFFYLLYDDALSLHERVGAVLAGQWNYAPAFGLRPQDFGELTVSLAIGAAFLSLLALLYARSGRAARDATKDLLLLLGSLAFFAVAVDMAHVVVRGLTIIEEGGELAVMSVMATYAAHLLQAPAHVAGLLWQSARARLPTRLNTTWAEARD